jgi:predicted DNA-binding transcriptional regulator AlpA
MPLQEEPLLEPLLDEKQVAEYFRLKPATLCKWRSEGGGPKYVRLGRLIRYKANDLKEWLQECDRYYSQLKKGQP